MAGQYVAYTFFKVDPAWRRLPIEERNAGKEAFAEVVEDWADRMSSLRTYSVGGVRPDSDFFLWRITERYEDLGELGAALNATPLAGWLETPSDPDSLISRTTADKVVEALPAIEGGMRPKLQAAVDAIYGGAGSSVIVDGRVQHSILLELFTDEGIGTMISAAS